MDLVENLHYRIRVLPDDWEGGSFRGGRYLCIEPGLSEGEWLWQVAHELGHAVLHRISEDSPFDRSYSWAQEREADDFAGELLIGFDENHQLELAEDMPEAKVREWLQRQYGVRV